MVKSRNKRKGSHVKRILAAALGLPLLIILVMYGIPFHFWLLLTMCILLGLKEFYRLLAENNTQCFPLVGLCLGFFVSIIFLKKNIPGLPSLAVYLIVLIPFLISLTQPDDFYAAMLKVFGTIVGVFYIAWLLSHLYWIRLFPQGKAMIFYLFLVVWVGDTAAFYTGSSLGKHKLSPRISPNKSIEGALGGMFGSIVVSAIAHFTFFKQITFVQSIFLGFLLNVLGQLGDLTESLIKRGSGVKDSGHLIPGHGGVLDRIDSILFAGPAFFYYIALYLSK